MTTTMKFDHLSKEQLTYLEGFVEKCGQNGVDSETMLKIAQSAMKDILGGAGEAFREATDVSGTPFMRWLGGSTDIGTPQAAEAAREYGERLKGMRQYINKPVDKMSPMEQALAEHYRGIFADPNVQAAGATGVPLKGWARLKYGLKNIIPWGRKERMAGENLRDQLARAQAQQKAILADSAKHPFKPPVSKPVNVAPVPIAGLQYTPYNEPYNFKAMYRSV